MAYLRKIPGTKNWIAAFIDGQGKLRNRSTRIPDTGTPTERAEAKRTALRIAEQYERAARGLLKREAAIRDTIRELIAAAGGVDVSPDTAAEFFAAWIDRNRTKPKTTTARYTQVARDFVSFLGDRATAPAEDVTATDVQAYLDTLTERGLAAKSIANQLKILRIPFGEAVRLGRLSFNPAGAVKTPSTALAVEREAFTTGEVAALLRAATGEWATVIRFAYFCGMRLGDSTLREWGDIDLEAGTVSFVPEKTRASKPKPLTLPLHPELAKHLASIQPKKAAGPITPTLAKERRANLSRYFQRIAAAAGIENPTEKTGVRSVSKKSFHSLRHSLTSHLATAGVAPEIRMKITGHSDLKTHSGYTHHEMQTLATALKLLSIEGGKEAAQ